MATGSTAPGRFAGFPPDGAIGGTLKDLAELSPDEYAYLTANYQITQNMSTHTFTATPLTKLIGTMHLNVGISSSPIYPYVVNENFNDTTNRIDKAIEQLKDLVKSNAKQPKGQELKAAIAGLVKLQATTA